MTEALRELIEKVEASEQPTPAMFRAVFEVPMQDMEYTVRPPLARDAYGGSLDAAKALHEAVVPDWTIGSFELDGEVSMHGPNDGYAHAIAWDNVGRAWLLAILRALSEAEG